MSEDAKLELDGNLTVEEITAAMQKIYTNRAPGPDGLTIEFYKTFQKQLLAPLMDMCRESYINGTLSPSLRLALITLILKPNKPSTECASYRPISLMGCDTKILCKALALRLDKYISSLIHNDQNGFVKNRHGWHNIRRVLNIINEKQESRDAALLSLDARQAFDRIEWPFLFNVLPRFGFGNNFLKWLKILYRNPTASIVTNNISSEPIVLERSTRQGCPLSPKLFILALEPLAMSIRMDTGLAGIQIGDQDHRLSLYADDIILFLTKLSTSVPNLLKHIKLFGTFSGYVINDAKSSMLFLNSEERLNPVVDTPFLNAKEGFTYLGVKITPHIKDVVQVNYDPLISDVQQSLDRWMTMPVSMMGRINILKMSILPKFLYFFQTIPLPLPECFFY